MRLLRLDTPELIDLAASRLAQQGNYQWLGAGDGIQLVTSALLKIMAHQKTHFIRMCTTDRDETLIGIAGLISVSSTFETGTLWGG
jgi:hypothetical protein